MHDALRMDNDFDALHLDSEEPVRLDHLQPFVEQRRGIDCDLRPHVPGRMFERLLRRDRIEFIARQFTKWSTGRGKNDATHIGNVEHRTSNAQPRTSCLRCWMLDVGCWMFLLLANLAFQTLKNR